ncbi:hypothetical protein GCM10011322_37810 [Salinarimonas ramus]|uniref:Transposase IS66 central domain-containing protein n=1 Tax=Salinarimonas ramus TaxID=690164 RepID=A0A917QEN0_9HYPH|nr:hypothetical protein GCM10011322_37810 [Salinarimonas ramus]
MTPAFYRAHVRRRFYELAAASGASIASEAIERIGVIYAVESEIRELVSDERRAARQAASVSLVEALGAFLRTLLDRTSGQTRLAEAIRYARARGDSLSRFLGDGRVERGINGFERAIRLLALTRKTCSSPAPTAAVERRSRWKSAAIFSRRPAAGCIHQSDRGSQAEEYRGRIEQMGLICPMGWKGNPGRCCALRRRRRGPRR